MTFSADQIEILKSSGLIPIDAPSGVVDAFREACTAHGLNPFRKEIYLTSYKDKEERIHYAMIVGIDGLQQKAARTGRLAGVDVEKYDLNADGSYKTATDFKQGEYPKSCTITVYAMVSGQKCGFTATAVFSEYYPNPTNKAKTMPFNMIAKCARAKALKMAFSDELSGLHIEEEAAAFQDTTINAQQEQEVLKEKINKTKSLKDLIDLYNSDPDHKNYADLFTSRKAEL